MGFEEELGISGIIVQAFWEVVSGIRGSRGNGRSGLRKKKAPTFF